MKKLFIIIAVISIFVAGCSKMDEEKINSSNNTKIPEIKLVTFSDGSKTQVTLLEFVDIDHYENTINLLKQQVEQLEEDFVAQYGYLDDDSLNSIEEYLGFNEQQPLIDFENYYNIPASMRQDFVAAEELWLDNEELDTVKTPYDKYCFEPEEMTLLNPYGEVKIGDKLYKFSNKGFVEIENSDYYILIRIDEGDTSAYSEPGVTTNVDFGGQGKDDCVWWKGKEYEHKYASNKRVIMDVHFHAYPWKAVSKAKIISYKKKRNRWKKFRMNLEVANQTYLRNLQCTGNYAMWSGWKSKKRKSLLQGNTHWAAFPGRRAENGSSVFGYFKYAGNDKTKALIW